MPPTTLRILAAVLALVLVVTTTTTTTATTAQPPPPNSIPVYNATDVVMGTTQTCVGLSDGSYKCFGAQNAFGQHFYPPHSPIGTLTEDLGDGLRETLLTPDTTNETIVSMQSMDAFTCAVFDSGRVKCWGAAGTDRAFPSQPPSVGFGRRDMGAALPYLDLGTFNATQVSVGSMQVCVVGTVLSGASRLKCFGNNNVGAVGLYVNMLTGMGDALPFVDLGVVASDNVVSVSCATRRTCVVIRDVTTTPSTPNRVKCYGQDIYGANGQGSLTTIGDNPNEMGDNLPFINLGSAVPSVAEVHASNAFTAVRFVDGRVKMFGNVGFSQPRLGLGTTLKSAGATPAEMGDALPFLSFPGGQTTLSVAVGVFGSCAVLQDFSVACWGQDDLQGSTGLGSASIAVPTRINLGTGVTARAVVGTRAMDVFCALLNGRLWGSLKCWGNNMNGNLGTGLQAYYLGANPASEMGDFLPVMGLSSATTWRNATNPLTVALSSAGTCVYVAEALKQQGRQTVVNKLYCFGLNTGTFTGCGVLQTTGSTYATMGEDLPRMHVGAGLFDQIEQVSMLNYATCVLLRDKRVKCAGVNFGRLGVGSRPNLGARWGHFTGNALPFASLVGPLDGAVARLSTSNNGDAHHCVVLTTGAIKCVGDGSSGQFGNGMAETLGDDAGEVGAGLPSVSFGASPDNDVVDVATGYAFTVVRHRNGNVRAFGANGNGQLGLGLPVATLGAGAGQVGAALPLVQLGGLGEGAVEVAAGSDFACAIRDDVGRNVVCWGANFAAQLAMPSSVLRWGKDPAHMGVGLPVVQLGTGLVAKALVLGNAHACALLESESDPPSGGVTQLKCWGSSSRGQTGLGRYSSSIGFNPGSEMGDALPFVNVGTGKWVLRASAGKDKTCVVRNDAKVVCFGDATALGFGPWGGAAPYSWGMTAVQMGDGLPIVDLSDGVYEPMVLTGAPSKAPNTGKPSALPSHAPSMKPSRSPSRVPSGAPSGAPSFAPVTAKPSMKPSWAPTKSPTSGAPTASPSQSPTLTFAPSQSPSRSPTKKPTPPTRHPVVTRKPTTRPTKLPTRGPTKRPTGAPWTKFG